MSLKTALAGKLTAEELAEARRAFDIVGSVAIVEVPEKLRGKERLIARAIMEQHPSVRTVCAKAGARRGKLRTRALRVIAGSGTVTEHVEGGCRYRMDVATVYFSPREATERLRVAGQVRAGERVLVGFAGCGPFAIAIAKKGAEVVGVELGKEAARYFQENAFLNRVAERVTVVQGDFRKEALRHGEFDRVVMPLPAEGWRYLPEALRALRKGGVVHFYALEGEGTMRFDAGSGLRPAAFAESEERLRAAAAKARRRVEVVARTRVHLYAPRVWKVCVEARVG